MNRIDLKNKNGKKILTACLGQCVHVAGTYNFINIANQLGYKCKFLGPAIPTANIIKEIQKQKYNIVGLSYRLTPSTVEPLLKDFIEKYKKLEKKPERLFFAGTPEVVDVAKEYNIFDEYFVGGESKYKLISILKNDRQSSKKDSNIPMDIISRIKWKKPYPIIRAHFGLSNFGDTIEGI